ncbi:MAG: glycosyltransferase family 2 protein [Bacteroidales bacterium]|nr:glycosyltransferase family 2 protein [Bacteroidales bacterium]
MNKIAIVILNWNGLDFLKRFLPIVISHSTHPDIDIYVADNGSTDDSLFYVKSNHPEIKIISLEKNFGFAGGYNQALKNIKSEYFIILNSDVETTPDWIFPVINYMDKNKNVAACMPKIISYKNREYFEHAGAAGGFIDKYGFPFCRGRIFDQLEKDNGQFNDRKEIFWATGACLFIRAELYKSEGGFDDDFFAHMEEIDLCWRLKNKGYKIVYIPDVAIYHVGGGTLPNENPHKIFLNFRNNLYLLYKNLPTKKIFIVFFIRLFLDKLAAIKFLFQGEPKNSFAVFKAYISFYSNLKSFKKKRKKLLKFNQNQDHPEILKSSLVYDFFVKRKTTFDKLEF